MPQISLPKLTFNFFLIQRIMAREQKEGGKMVSSIESLNFSVTLENDVEITVKGRCRLAAKPRFNKGIRSHCLSKLAKLCALSLAMLNGLVRKP